MPVSVTIGAQVPDTATKALQDAVASLSDDVTVRKVDHGPQNAIEWFLPALTVVSFLAGTAGTMVLKGFFKELGTEALGEAIARGAKDFFKEAADLGHWYTPNELKALAHRKEGQRKTPTLKPRRAPVQSSKRSPPLAMEFQGGSTRDHADPPWSCSFKYGWDTEPVFADSYAAMLETISGLETFRRIRLAQIDSLLTKPARFFGTMPLPLVATQVEMQMQEVAGGTSGDYVFDLGERRWTRIAPRLSYSEDAMVDALLTEITRRKEGALER